MPPISNIVQPRLRGALVLSQEQIDEFFGDPAKLRQRQQAHDMSPASPGRPEARGIVAPRALQHASSSESASRDGESPIEVINPFTKHSDPFTLHGTTYWNYMVTPPLYYVSRYPWEGTFRFICKITEANVARTYPQTVREKITVSFDDDFDMKVWACAGSQLYNALGLECQLFRRGTLVVLENVEVVWNRNEKVIVFGIGSNIARLDDSDKYGPTWRDVVHFNERIND
ncbi:uncharacterized protein PSANT_06323 [Moesziomyces antarcticus]|uniref:Uncharacterized protein n=1 Tax=Pseudozyma antarctica TaxID=84753 RepID=A0A5C3FWD6_PSEA2|nr:uncharacterized protein PSANT_06323 [Moesziomyces antarcticus]